MKTKPDKQLVQYCEALMVLSVFSATCFGVSNIFPICYELGKDASETFIWFALVQGIKAYAMFFIAALTYFLARNVRNGSVFTSANQHRSLLPPTSASCLPLAARPLFPARLSMLLSTVLLLRCRPIPACCSSSSDCSSSLSR